MSEADWGQHAASAASSPPNDFRSSQGSQHSSPAGRGRGGHHPTHRQQPQQQPDDTDEDEYGLPRRHSSLSLPEEVVLGVSPPTPHDCVDCLHLHRQRSASHSHHAHAHAHAHHHHHHQHSHHSHGPPPPPLNFSPQPSPSTSPPTPNHPISVSSSSAAPRPADGLPPRLPVPLQQRQSSVLPSRPPPDLTSSPSAFAFSPSYSYQPPPAPPAPSPHVFGSGGGGGGGGGGVYAVPQSPPPGIITKPHRIILVRHGESTGNVDEKVYTTTPDWKVPLSPKGHEQARELGRRLKGIIGNEPLYIYTSPYLRTKQTLAGLLESFEENLKVGIREEPRITEQQFGNFQNHEEMQQCKRQRNSFGRFYYRFPDGESGLDVYTRVTSFISTMFRDFADWRHICRPDLNIVIITHGLTLRLLLMRWFKLTVDTFESTTNPPNGSFVVMARKEGPQIHGRSGGGVYELAPESAALISLSYTTVPVGPSLQTPTSAGLLSPTGENNEGGCGEEGEKEGKGEAQRRKGDGDGGVAAAALTDRLRTLELRPASLSLSGGDASGCEGWGQG